MNIKRIAFDVMGSDYGPAAAVAATMDFIKKYENYSVVLVGDENIINETLVSMDRISVLHNPNVVSKTSSLRYASSEDNSMNTALKLLKEGVVDACMSPGESAKILTSSIFILKRLDGVSRPAFMPIFPTVIKNKKFLMLDVGANLDINADYLVQWAKLGQAFSKAVLKIKDPKVSILNVGTEENKGFEAHGIANKKLSKLKEEGIMNYVGFVEGRDLLTGDVDVVVTDGYAGNICLKTMEGVIINFQKLIKKNLTSNFFRKICALFLKSAFNDVKEHLDYRNVGAAWVIGVEGIVIKCHGSSDRKSYNGALEQVKLALDANALEEYKKVL
ncbi:MAG: phosphate acyltransferase PlsX [Metamycoplasmataceae bacterium]